MAVADLVERLRAHDSDGDIHCEAAAEIERLRAALEAIKTIKPLEPIGYGDPYAEMVVSAVAIATNALAGRALEPKL